MMSLINSLNLPILAREDLILESTEYNSYSLPDKVQQIKKVREFIGHSGPIFCSDSHKDFLYTGSYDKTLNVWQISTGKCLNSLRPSPNSWVASICFDRKANILTSSTWDGIIKVN